MILDDYIGLVGMPTGGAVRVSLGLASNFADVYRFMAFATEFADLTDVPSDLPARLPARGWTPDGRGAERLAQQPMRSRWMTSRNTCDSEPSPLKSRSKAACGSTSRRSARGWSRSPGRTAVDQALVPERQAGTCQSCADAAAAADDDLLDGAVDRQVARGRGGSFRSQRAVRRATGERRR